MSSFPKLSYACPIAWSTLEGDERSRFCEKCGHSVVNFSLLDEKARRALLAKAETERMCVTYYRRLSGEFVTPDSPLTPQERAGLKQIGIAALSAGALALAAGCMSTGKAPVAGSPQSAPPASANSVPKNLGALSQEEKLARYDNNKNGELEPNEVTAMFTDLNRSADAAPANDRMVLQAFGIVASITPAEMKRGLAHQIQIEKADRESKDPSNGRYSEEDWSNYWKERIWRLRDPQQIGGVDPHAEEYVRYIVSQRRKYHLPELKP